MNPAARAGVAREDGLSAAGVKNKRGLLRRSANISLDVVVAKRDVPEHLDLPSTLCNEHHQAGQ